MDFQESKTTTDDQSEVTEPLEEETTDDDFSNIELPPQQSKKSLSNIKLNFFQKRILIYLSKLLRKYQQHHPSMHHVIS